MFHTLASSFSRIIRRANPELVVLDHGLVDADFGGWIVQGCTGFHIKSPGVVGANDAAVFYQALAERAFVVGAGVVEDGDFAVDTGDTEAASGHFTDAPFLGQITLVTDLYQLTHSRTPSE
jgi:hypothetical protein